MFEKAFAAASDFDHIGLLVRRKICHSGAQGRDRRRGGGYQSNHKGQSIAGIFFLGTPNLRVFESPIAYLFGERIGR
jgi:hypothetical protein